MAHGDSDCWSISEAETRLHAYTAPGNDGLELALTRHSTERMEERGIIVADIMHVLATGRIDDEPTASTRPGYCKYTICGKSPNSGNREICVVVIPDPDRPAIKVITVMWKDVR